MSHASHPRSAEWTDFLDMDLSSETERPTVTVTASDGRKLAAASYGPDTGRPVFLLHGSPGSRLGPVPRAKELYQCGLRVITYDRPGYGLSEPRDTAVVADTADDVLRIADHFGIRQFAVIGRSGGGPHALACGVLLPPERLQRTAVMVGLEPPEHAVLSNETERWHQGMVASNVEVHTANAEARRARIEQMAGAIALDPARLFGEWWGELRSDDRTFVENGMIAKQLLRSYKEAVRQGDAGWQRDTEALHNPNGWGFQFKRIWKPILIWHGRDDPFSPIQHARNLADAVPNSQLIEVPGASHFSAFDAFIKVAGWAVSGRGTRETEQLFSDDTSPPHQPYGYIPTI